MVGANGELEAALRAMERPAGCWPVQGAAERQIDAGAPRCPSFTRMAISRRLPALCAPTIPLPLPLKLREQAAFRPIRIEALFKNPIRQSARPHGPRR
jgi:hypothetical protein